MLIDPLAVVAGVAERRGDQLRFSLRDVPDSFYGRGFGRGVDERLAALGFEADDDGALRTVPTPEGFARRMARLGLARHGLRSEVRVGHPGVPGRAWLRGVARGVLLTRVLPPRLARMLRVPPCDDALLAHDLGLHLLAFHMLPSRFVRWLRSRAAVALRERTGTVADFVEGPLTRTCRDAWDDVTSPDDFFDAFRGRAPEVIAPLGGDWRAAL